MYEISQLKGASLDAILFFASENRDNRLPPTLQMVFDEICELFDLKPEDILSARQFRDHVIFRQLFSYVAMELCRTTLKNVGEFLGGYNHSTISNHRIDVKNWIEKDDDILRPIWNFYRIESKLWNQRQTNPLPAPHAVG